MRTGDTWQLSAVPAGKGPSDCLLDKLTSTGTLVNVMQVAAITASGDKKEGTVMHDKNGGPDQSMPLVALIARGTS